MRAITAAVLSVCCATACGSDTEHEPLISGTVTGDFRGTSFTIAEGVADYVDSGPVIVLGTKAMNCDSADSPSPPRGYFASIPLPDYEVGVHTSVLITVFENNGNFSGTGSNRGTVEITASDEVSVAGTVAYAYTDDETGDTYALDGTFEVIHCPQ